MLAYQGQTQTKILCSIVYLFSESQIPGFNSVLDPGEIWVMDFLSRSFA